MPNVSRKGDALVPDVASSAMSTSGSPTVLVNGIPCHRKTDTWATHTTPYVATHVTPSTTEGSPTVFVNGLPIARVGDPISCGTTIQTGSPTVFAN